MHHSGNIVQSILTPNIILVSRPKPASFEDNKDLTNNANMCAHVSTWNQFFSNNNSIHFFRKEKKKAILPFDSSFAWKTKTLDFPKQKKKRDCKCIRRISHVFFLKNNNCYRINQHTYIKKPTAVCTFKCIIMYHKSWERFCLTSTKLHLIGLSQMQENNKE